MKGSVTVSWGLLVLCTLYACALGHLTAEKSGSCPQPPSYPRCGDLIVKPANSCSTDQQCPGQQKCCYYGCSLQCKQPLQEKLGSCQDFDRAKCVHVRPLPNECENDSQCPGAARCCCQNCRKACSETVKSGICPPIKAKCTYPLPDSRCKNDSGCLGRQKCCSFCGDQCLDPEPENPGICPVDPEIENQCGFLPPPLCSRDAECAPNEKCCRFGCRVQCVKALTAKSGVCPNILAKCKVPLDPDQCQSDGECLSNKKCCNRCGKKCSNPEPVHDGFCPAPKPVKCDTKSVSECSRDSGCKANEKCCDDGCRMACVMSVKEKSGSCPFIHLDESSQDMCNKCNNDGDCPKNEKCCAGVKGRECQDPQPGVVIVKDGECPRRINWCDYPPPYKHQCDHDGNCSGGQKCCIQICTRECLDAVPVKPHPGTCPPDNIKCIRAEDDKCKTDSICKEDEKCCYSRCGLKCVPAVPVKPHPGTCPPDNIRCIRADDDQCKTDSICKEDEKCCYSRCGLKCVPAVPVKPKAGICPVDTIVCIQKEEDRCKIDSDCEGHEKCCYNRCGLKCMDAVKEKAGQCPVPTTVCAPVTDLPVRAPNCTYDSDCPGAQKCCIPLCERQCTDPVAEDSPKPGTCPPDPIRCSQPADDLCKSDNECKGNDKCCHDHCGLKCVTALPVTEKDGSCPLPPSYPTCKTFPTKPKDQCATDLQCPDDEKCCEYGCSLKCKKPLQDKLGSCPDFNGSICIYARPAPAECSEDNQCPGTQRCCCHGACRMECAETAPDKRGICPRISAKCKASLPEPECKDDRGCKGKKKCCFMCGWKCITPAENPGYCPAELEKEAQCGYQRPPQCTSDSDCALNEKCCMFGCGVQCVKALAAKPGMCPAIMAGCLLPFPEPECQTDGDCLANKKCCQLCGNVCLDAVPDHEGVCPSYINVLMTCPARYSPSCNHDWYCAKDEKCCNVGCKRECVKALKEKMGFCPDKIKYTESADRCDKCNTDKDCPRMERCCAGVKGRECIPPLMFTGLPLPTRSPATKG